MGKHTNLIKGPGWKETSFPEASKKGYRTFENEKIGEKLGHDKGKTWEKGHEAHDHYHRPNSNSTGNHNKYLDAEGIPVPKGSESSHLYSLE